MCVALAYVMLHSASSMLIWEHRRARCGWEDRIMSNRESKIVIFKAALCCGFAIALRALFLGILSYSPSLAEGVWGWVVMLRRSRNISKTSQHEILHLQSRFRMTLCHCERAARARQTTVLSVRRRLIASHSSECSQWHKDMSLQQTTCERGNQTYMKLESWKDSIPLDCFA